MNDTLLLKYDEKHREHAEALMAQLNSRKDDYFSNGVGDEDEKIEFLTQCKVTIESNAEYFKGNLGILKSVANFFINLVNLVLPSKMKFGLFEPKKTETQDIVKSLESKLGIRRTGPQRRRTGYIDESLIN